MKEKGIPTSEESKANSNLDEQWFILEHVNEEGKYIKAKYREIEEFSFFLRFIGSWFIPCKECQEKIKELVRNKDMILGNKSYEPPVEFQHRFVIDDFSWVTLEERKATKKDEKELGKYGIRTKI